MKDIYSKIKLKDGRTATIVDSFGEDYIADVGTSPADWDTIIISPGQVAEWGSYTPAKASQAAML